ncbi:MAG: hypothetical protein J3K34DRAFT_406833 [Monoraphidium minutum]|nr:MAG: hypothetical protein J3K34DRAFT_406833 [Monoraphidium minutum]
MARATDAGRTAGAGRRPARPPPPPQSATIRTPMPAAASARFGAPPARISLAVDGSPRLPEPRRPHTRTSPRPAPPLPASHHLPSGWGTHSGATHLITAKGCQWLPRGWPRRPPSAACERARACTRGASHCKGEGCARRALRRCSLLRGCRMHM